MKKFPTALVILDGFGYRAEKKYNAIAQASTPTLDYIYANYPSTFLKASGAAVGLPDHSMGNSEVGHLTIGAGRIVKQPITYINEMITDGIFCTDPMTQKILKTTIDAGRSIHVMGLLSDANVHSNYNHLDAFLERCVQEGFKNIIVHPFLDGRDTPPRSAGRYLADLDQTIMELNAGRIGSIHGRFYSMDRDHNWQRTERSYQTLTQAVIPAYLCWQDALSYYYDHSITDEFIPPTMLHEESTVRDGDCIFFFNVRPDRARQLASAFVGPAFDGFERKKINLKGFIAPVPYDRVDLLPMHVLFKRPVIYNTLKEVINDHNKTIFSIAETEKYAHVTYFFNGEREEILSHEERVLIPSIVTKSYIEYPDMSAAPITQAIIQSLHNNPKDFYLINYANADMVAHSGSLPATIKAIEYLDTHIKQLYEHFVQKMDGILYITGDHGNAECMYDEDENQPHTFHTNDPVPFIMVTQEHTLRNSKLLLKELSDIAPFILKNMGLPIPVQMKR